MEHRMLFPAVLAVMLGTALAGEKEDLVSQSKETASQSAGKETAVEGAAAQCKAHGADKEDCFICDPALREKGRLWRKERDRYEDRRFLCHPELKKDAKAKPGPGGTKEKNPKNP